jgi:hypothetical protein
VAIDGSKIKANASKHKAMSYGRMESRARELEDEVRKWLAAAEAADAEEDKLYGRDKRGDELPDWVADKQKRAEKIRAAKAKLRRPRLLRKRKPKPGPKPKRSAKPKAARSPASPPRRPRPSPTRKRIETARLLSGLLLRWQCLCKRDLLPRWVTNGIAIEVLIRSLGPQLTDWPRTPDFVHNSQRHRT